MDHHLPNLTPVSHTPPNQLDNEFAELDPFLSPSQGDLQQPVNSDPSEGGNEWGEFPPYGVEVGVEATRETEEPTFAPTSKESGGEVGGEENSSPIESVLYSHSHY